MDQKERLCKFGRKLWERGFVAANDGNISLRLGENRFLVTPAGVSKGELTREMLLVVDGTGAVLEPAAGYRPSSELPMHVMCYALRKEIGAVVHAHPPAATAFACARRPIDAPILGEFLMTLKEVPVSRYGRTGTQEIPEAIAPLVKEHNGILLANHGALTLGQDLESAYYRMESLEHTARIYLYTIPLGGGIPLSEQEAEALRAL